MQWVPEKVHGRIEISLYLCKMFLNLSIVFSQHRVWLVFGQSFKTFCTKKKNQSLIPSSMNFFQAKTKQQQQKDSQAIIY